MATTAHTHASAAGMSKAAKRFVDSLSDDQRDKTIYEYMDGERIFWYYPPVNRHGLPLRGHGRRPAPARILSHGDRALPKTRSRKPS